MDYKDINLKKYLQVLATIKEHDGDELTLRTKVIAIIFDLTEDEVLDLPLEDFAKYNQEISFLYKKANKTAKIPDTIVLNNRKYRVCKDVNKLVASQYIDYQSYLAMEDSDAEAARVLSVFLIPEGEKYGHYDIEPVIEEIKEYMPAQMALDVCFFFEQKCRRSIRHTLRYLLVMTKAIRMQRKTPMEVKEKMKDIEGKLTRTLIVLRKNGCGLEW